MSKDEIIYPYGFMFATSRDYTSPSYYEHRRVMDKYEFHYDDRNDLMTVEEDDRVIIIYGRFVHIGIDESIEENRLPNLLLYYYFNNHNKFLDTIDYMGGRYVIIIGTNENAFFYTDATSSRSTYFSIDKDLVSSHSYMIAENIDCKESPFTEISRAMNYTYDFSPYIDIKAIAPNFYLDFLTKKLVRFYPRKDNRFGDIGKEEKFRIAEKLWKGQIEHYIGKYENVLLSLTGGNDSRTTLAMLRDYKDKIKTFTYAPVRNGKDNSRAYNQTNDLDRQISTEMAADLNLNHKCLYYGDNQQSNLPMEYSEAIDKNVVNNHGRFLISHYLTNFQQENTVHIRANLLEIGRSYITSSSSSINDDTFIELLESFVSYASNKEFSGKLEDLDRLKDIAKEKNTDFYGGADMRNFNIMDLAFWETRMGRWNSEIFNETDVVFDSFSPFNMRAIIELSLSFTLAERKMDYFFKELINRNYPVLNFYGFNNEKNLYEQVKEGNIYSTSHFHLFSSGTINEMKIYNDEKKLMQTFETLENEIFIPKDYIIENYSTETEMVFSQNKGTATLSVLSKYMSDKARGYLEYEICHNDNVILREDIAEWKHPNQINIFNLNKGDRIKVRVKAVRTTQSISWQKASIIEVLSYEEIEHSKDVDRKISFTSPFSVEV